MSIPDIRPMLLATAFALAACAGDGSFVASIPTPPPLSSPPKQEWSALLRPPTSQQFAAIGSSHLAIDDFKAPSLDASDQLQVRYVASSDSYEVQLPHSDQWASIAFDEIPGLGLANYRGSTAYLWVRTSPAVGYYDYSRLFEWSDLASSINGHEAIGMATPEGAVPVTGTANYSGQILGQTSENHSDGTDLALDGSIYLAFDFGAGSLSGNITPDLHQSYGNALGAISFQDTVYSVGSTTFSGSFDTGVAGLNSFSGQFTGPHAEELIGNFAFPYRSPIDGLTYEADGAFIAGK